MSRTVDEAGRVVIPKELRDKLGIEEGMSVEFHARERELVLTLSSTANPMSTEGGLLVHNGEPQGDLDEAVKTHREQRVADVSEDLDR